MNIPFMFHSKDVPFQMSSLLERAGAQLRLVQAWDTFEVVDTAEKLGKQETTGTDELSRLSAVVGLNVVHASNVHCRKRAR